MCILSDLEDYEARCCGNLKVQTVRVVSNEKNKMVRRVIKRSHGKIKITSANKSITSQKQQTIKSMHANNQRKQIEDIQTQKYKKFSTYNKHNLNKSHTQSESRF